MISLLKIIGVFILCSIVTSCNNNGEQKPEVKTVVTVIPAVFNKSDCASCHQQNEMMVGPSYQDIANRYTNTESDKAILISSILKGSTGKYGNVPMMAHPTISQQDVNEMVNYIMSLKK